MSDEKLRDLERRFRETGSVEDELAWVAARLQVGEVPDWTLAFDNHSLLDLALLCERASSLPFRGFVGLINSGPRRTSLEDIDIAVRCLLDGRSEATRLALLASTSPIGGPGRANAAADAYFSSLRALEDVDDDLDAEEMPVGNQRYDLASLQVAVANYARIALLNLERPRAFDRERLCAALSHSFAWAYQATVIGPPALSVEPLLQDGFDALGGSEPLWPRLGQARYRLFLIARSSLVPTLVRKTPSSQKNSTTSF